MTILKGMRKDKDTSEHIRLIDRALLGAFGDALRKSSRNPALIPFIIRTIMNQKMA